MIIDLSENNSVLSFKTLKDNVEGIILRLGYRGYGKNGNFAMDKKFDKYAKKCIELSIPWGVYFVTTAVNKTEGIEEGIYVKSVLDGYDTSNMILGIWCDTESTGHPSQDGRSDHINKKDRTDAVLGFVDYFENLNMYCGIYASENWFNERLEFGRCIPYHKWVANYYRSPKIVCDYWQASSHGEVNGMITRVDISQKMSFLKSYDVTIRLFDLRRGMKNDTVKIWQLLVGVDADGSFGKNTQAATETFQRNNELDVTGIVTSKEWESAFARYIV